MPLSRRKLLSLVVAAAFALSLTPSFAGNEDKDPLVFAAASAT
jgi:hypothetical protein